MGRSSCCDEHGLKRGPWSSEEDQKLIQYIQNHGHGSWRALPKLAGLNRCGKSCRLRWTNYLRPDIKRGKFSQEEEDTILHLHSILGNKWSSIASQLPGRTDNDIKNFWNTCLKKKLIRKGIDPVTHQPRTEISASLQQHLAHTIQKELIERLSYDHHGGPLQAQAVNLAKLQFLHLLLLEPWASTGTSSSSHVNNLDSISSEMEPMRLWNAPPIPSISTCFPSPGPLPAFNSEQAHHHSLLGMSYSFEQPHDIAINDIQTSAISPPCLPPPLCDVPWGSNIGAGCSTSSCAWSVAPSFWSDELLNDDPLYG